MNKYVRSGTLVFPSNCSLICAYDLSIFDWGPTRFCNQKSEKRLQMFESKMPKPSCALSGTFIEGKIDGLELLKVGDSEFIAAK